MFVVCVNHWDVKVEMRLMAHFSEDQGMCDLFLQGGDVFKRMAARWQGIDETAVTSELRSRVKKVWTAKICTLCRYLIPSKQ